MRILLPIASVAILSLSCSSAPIQVDPAASTGTHASLGALRPRRLAASPRKRTARPQRPHAAPRLADDCSSAPLIPLGPTPVVLHGDTTDKVDDYGVSYNCGDRHPQNSAPDMVAHIDTSAGGILDIRAQATGATPTLNPALYLRSDCDQEFYCWDFGATAEHLKLEVPAGSDWYAIVDGSANTAGPFTLTIALTPPTCGDGIVSGAEQCDVGAPAPGDGCGDPGSLTECQYDPPLPAAETLPGEMISIPLGDSWLAGTTLGYADNLSGACSQHGPGPDRVYSWTAPSAGVLSVWLGYDAAQQPACATDIMSPYCWDGVLYLLTWNGTAWVPPPYVTSGDIACSDLGAAQVEYVQAHVVAGGLYAVVLDGYDGEYYSTGVSNVKFTFQ